MGEKEADPEGLNHGTGLQNEEKQYGSREAGEGMSENPCTKQRQLCFLIKVTGTHGKNT